MLAFPFQSLPTLGLPIAARHTIFSRVNSWELRQIERSDGLQPGGEGTLGTPVHIPAKPRTNLGSVWGEAAAAKLSHKIILVDGSWSSPLGV